MSIEDVDYLKEHSHRQAYTFLVDSKDRDKRVYPTPSEYIVEFTTPFRNVIGMEVIDASIPRTMYNVDVINNKLRFFIHDNTYNLESYHVAQSVEIAVPEGDYTIQTLIPALNRLLFMHVNNQASKPIAYITAKSTTNPPDVQNKLAFHCPYPFFFDLEHSSIAETLGFDMFTQEAEASVPILSRQYDNPWYHQGFYRRYHSVDVPPQLQLGEERTVFEGPRGVLRSLSVQSPTHRVAQRFFMTSMGYLYQVFAAFTAVELPNEPVRWSVYPGTALAPNTLHDPLVTGTIAVSYVDGTLSDSNQVMTRLEENSYYWIVFESNANVSIFYNDVLQEETSLRIGNNWASIDANGVYYNASIQIIVRDEYHMLKAPGMYTLVGPRYIIMRCQEIEENSFRSLAYSKYHLGIAKFRLGVVGYSENRMDYSKVPVREFHPIGKLRRLSLRFELSTGELYDFKGVNHTITFSIHYYEPTSKVKFSASILNPNYRGNFIEYMYKQEEQESDSDDQEEEFSRDHLPAYRRQEQAHAPETEMLRDLDFIRAQRMMDDLEMHANPSE